MKKNLLKILCTLLAGFLLILPLCLSASADSAPSEWALSPDGTVLSNEYESYTLYTLPQDCYRLPRTTLHQYSAYELSGQEVSYLYITEAAYWGSGVIYLECNGIAGLYLSESAKQGFEQFERGENVSHHLLLLGDAYVQGDLSDNTVNALSALSPTVQIDVQELAQADAYELAAYDSTGTVYRVSGILFRFADGSFGFVNYRDLNNSHFNADGAFSFRSGTAPVCMVEADALKTDLSKAIDNTYYIQAVEEYQGNAGNELFMEEASVPLFWILSVFTGFLLPIAPLVFSLIMATSKVSRKRYRWYILTALSALWMILASILLVIMLV